VTDPVVLLVTVSQFRTDIPAFKSPSDYPDPMITNYLRVASQKLDPLRWGEMTTLGVEWFTAHFLALMRADDRAAAQGGTPGQVNGPITSKSAGPVSISYDTNASIEANGGFWNLTTYGKMFLRYARMAGMGGVQVGPDPCFNPFGFPGTNQGIGYWQGPYYG
jgi:uncharacterized protein DUF4054